jgi:hypothetical protein
MSGLTIGLIVGMMAGAAITLLVLVLTGTL